MWYRTAIDLGKLFGINQEEEKPKSVTKPDVPEDVFREHVKANIPRPPIQIETGLGSQHLILTGTGDIHQGVSHSMFLERILDSARKSVSSDPELREKYNTSRLPEYAYGPEDLVQRRNKSLTQGQEKMHPEDAVTEILHEYFDQGIRISNMAGYMAINAVHKPSLMQIRELLKVIEKLQPQKIAISIKTDEGDFMEFYDFKNVAKIENDILQFKMYGPKKQSNIGEWRRY